MDYKKYIAEKLSGCGQDADALLQMIETPPANEMGDFALPCFKLSKIMRKSPAAIADGLKDAFVCDDVIGEVTSVNGYLNFKINRKSFAQKTVAEILEKKERYGSSNHGEGKTVCIDYSSVNIAKPFHIGHLSTTVLGAALCNIYRFTGYKTVGINHLGDYGTQFGKLIVAFKKWSDEESVRRGKLEELTRIYVKYHEEAEKDPSLDDEARRYFKLIEEGDAESLRLFNLFKEITLSEVQKIYDLLSVRFDSFAGESFYNDKMQPVIDELQSKGLLTDSDGAKVVDLSEYGMPPCLILKSDGSSLYATRDMAAAFYRKKTYDFHKCLYVVAYQQNLHFQQFFKVVELMGKDWAKDLVHVAYGMVSLEDGAMSTRRGKVVLLQDVIDKCVKKARETIEEKSPDLADKDETARKIGVGAVIFGALYNAKIKDIVFSYDKVLSFEGETCPYVQYTVARCLSVLEKGGRVKDTDIDFTLNASEYAVVSMLGKFPGTVESARDKYEPSFIARFAVDLASAFNKFYFDCKIIGEEAGTEKKRLAITECVSQVLINALALLGISHVEKM